MQGNLNLNQSTNNNSDYARLADDVLPNQYSSMTPNLTTINPNPTTSSHTPKTKASIINHK